MKFMAEITDFESFRNETKFMEIVDVDLFKTILDIYGEGGLSSINSGLSLNIIQSKGIDVTLDFDVKTTDLNTDNNNKRYKQFINNGDGGITFKVDVIIRDLEGWGYGVISPADYINEGRFNHSNGSKRYWLEFWHKQMRPLYIVSDAIDIPNGTYLLTKISSKKQEFQNYTVWSLEFETFTPLNLKRWAVAQSISDALNPKKTTTKTSTTKVTELKQCTANGIVYSKTKNATLCNKLMQEKLYKLGFLRQDQIDSWYGDVTMEAIKKFQKWYNKKGHNLLVDGICGAVTLKALINS